MKNLLYISTLVVLGACGLSEDKFADKFVETYCEAWDGCNTSGDACPITADDTSTDDAADCTYDSKQAKECLDAEFTCDDSFGEGFEFVLPPEACATVYDCGDATGTTTTTGGTTTM